MRRYVMKMLGCDPRSPEDIHFRKMLYGTVFKPITYEELCIEIMINEQPEYQRFSGCVEYDPNREKL